MQKRYNLATPELISKLQEIGATTDKTVNHAKNNRPLYRVIIKSRFVVAVDALLTGTKCSAHGNRGCHAFYSKDVWNTLRENADRRNTYGHNKFKPLKRIDDSTRHCGMPINSFMFSDGSVIRKCTNEQCTRFDVARQQVLSTPMGQGVN